MTETFDFKQRYIEVAKRFFKRRVSVLERTELLRIARRLEMSLEEVEGIWKEI